MYPNIEAKVCMWNCEEEIKDPTTLDSLSREFKGDWKEGLVQMERDELLFWRACSAQCEIWLWSLGGSNLLPSKHTKFPISVAGTGKDWGAAGKEAAQAFCVYMFQSCQFLLFPSVLLLFPQGCPLPSLPEPVVSLGLMLISHVGGEQQNTEPARNLAMAWTKHTVGSKSPGA